MNQLTHDRLIKMEKETTAINHKTVKRENCN